MNKSNTKLNHIRIAPHPGKQTLASASPADIVLYGGSAGCGKSRWLMMQAARYFQVPGYVAKIFRRTYPEIADAGGLWDKSHEIYPHLGGKANNSDLYWEFPCSNKQWSTVDFGHLQYDHNIHQHQGKEYAFIGFDELAGDGKHAGFTKKQFWYLRTRNRSTCGVRPVINATFNPDPDHFVKEIILGWLDSNGQYAREDMAGKMRWMVLDSADDPVWHDTDESEFYRIIREKRKHDDPGFLPMSVAFIPGSLEDNPSLGPEYRSTLANAPLIERQRLLHGDWKIKASAGTLFKSGWFQFAGRLPKDIKSYCRYWDRAATEKKAGNDPDYTAGVLMARAINGTFWVIDVKHFRGTPMEVERQILATASQDRELYGRVEVGIEQDPGQAGKFEASHYSRLLSGFNVRLYPAKQSKIKRAEPFSAQCEAGNVFLLQDTWNARLINELEQFPDGVHDDIVDACSGAFNALQKGAGARIGTNWI